MNMITGTVAQVRSESKVSKAGKPFTIHYATITGADGSNTEVNMKFKQLYSQGDQVSCPVKAGYGGRGWEYDPDGTGGGAAPSNTGGGYSKPAAVPFKSGKTFPLAADHADNVIVRQNSLAHATQLWLGSNPAPTQSADEIVQEVTTIALGLTKWATGRADLEAVTAGTVNSATLS